MKIELKDTIYLMQSPNYRERFIAEYWQLKIRYEKLKRFNEKIEAARLTGAEEPKHDCPLELLTDQQMHMGQLLRDLEARAVIEKVDFESIERIGMYMPESEVKNTKVNNKEGNK